MNNKTNHLGGFTLCTSNLNIYRTHALYEQPKKRWLLGWEQSRSCAYKTHNIWHIWIFDCPFRICLCICVVVSVTTIASELASCRFFCSREWTKEVLSGITFHCASKFTRNHSTLKILFLKIKLMYIIVHIWVATSSTSDASSREEICELLSHNCGLLSISFMEQESDTTHIV